MSIAKQTNNKLDRYLDKLKDLSKPISLRSGMLINTPYKYLGSKKKLLMVGFNPGNVPEYSETTIDEDWNRHSEDLSFNAMDECWGANPIKAPGCHPIQLLYQAFINKNNTSLGKEDVLVTNLYWQRSKSIKKLDIDDKLKKACYEGFLISLEEHQPDTICFLGHNTAEEVRKNRWTEICLVKTPTKYPWGQNQKVRNYRMKFNGKGINTFSIPHPSRFGFGNNPERLTSILDTLKKNGVS